MKSYLLLSLIPLLLIVPVTSYGEDIPSWIKNTAGWWADEEVSDKEFVNAMGFLIKSGIISLPKIQSTDGIPVENIFFLIKNDEIKLTFEGKVIPVPVVPVFFEMIHPNGEITEKNKMIGPNGEYSFVEIFPDNTEPGIYQVNLIFNNKIIRNDNFKLEKAVSKETTIPQWIKNNAKWWTENQIDESSFVSGIQYLVNERIIVVESNDIGKSTFKPLPSQNYKTTHIEGFPDPLKTPEYYFDRYYSEIEYRNWFDRQFPNSSIYEVLGLDDSEKLYHIFPSNVFLEDLGIMSSSINLINPEIRLFDYVGGVFYKTKLADIDIHIGVTQEKIDTETSLKVMNLMTAPYDAYNIEFQDVLCTGRPILNLCTYDKYVIFTENIDELVVSSQEDRKLAIVLLDKIFQNISTVENLNYESKISPFWLNSESVSTGELWSSFIDKKIERFPTAAVYQEGEMIGGYDEFEIIWKAVESIQKNVEPTVSSTPGFSGLYCTQDEYGYITMSGFFTNGPDSYSSIWFTLGILDNQGRIVSTGIGDVSNIGPYQTKMFDATTKWSGSFSECIIEVDSAIP